ncbi:MAG: S41 family peptidase [Alphaproteobacteria bacterium]|nr:S41 family peptidase [Alphaproteobacteria bacterium]
MKTDTAFLTKIVTRAAQFRVVLLRVSARRMVAVTSVILAVAVIGLASLLWTNGSMSVSSAAENTGQNKSSLDTYKQLALFGEAFERARANYVDPVNDQKLIEAAINGMLTSLDPHSVFWNEKEAKAQQTDQKGEFGGLGIEITMEGGFVKVVTPIDDTPAAKAGVKSGDLIVQINGESVQGMTINEAVERMRGKVDTEIKISIRRDGRETFDVTLRRAIIKVEAVRGDLMGDVAYIRMTAFSEQTESGLLKTFGKIKDKAKTKGVTISGVILDLRNNPGGLLDQAIRVSDDFLEQGEIVSTRGRRPADMTRFNAQSGDITARLPMVVIINAGSASAAEIVAGALQDNHRALIVGTKSFGKGSVQTVMPLGEQGAMKITTARYFTPSGRSIQAVGIEPDIFVPAGKLELFDEAGMIHEADMRGALANPNLINPNMANSRQKAPDKTPDKALAPKTDTSATDKKSDKAAPNAKPTEADDYQLQRAIDILHGVVWFSRQSLP